MNSHSLMASKIGQSHSLALTDLNRTERETETIRKQLKLAETSVNEHGWVTRTTDEMLDNFKDRARRDGEL